MATTTRRSLVGRAGAAARKVVAKKSAGTGSTGSTGSASAKRNGAAAATKKKSAAKKGTSTKASAKKASAKKATKKGTPTKTAAKKTTKSPAKKTTTKKTAANSPTSKRTTKAAAKKAPATKAAAKKASKSTATKTPAKKTTKSPAKKATTKTTTRKASPKKTPAKKAPATKAGKKGATAGAQTTARGRGPAALVVREDESPWTAAELAEVRGQLREDVDRLTAELADVEEDVAGMMRNTGEGAGNDPADVGSASFERDQEMTIANNAREMLVQSEHALERIVDGSYGICESCGNPIGKNRLMVFPRATLCLSCKQREERR